MSGVRILVVDNFDSFVYNLVQYVGQLGVECDVRRNDEVAVSDVGSYAGVLLSPGPGTPENAGPCVELVRECAGRVPLLGVCLGHQAIGVAYGATVDRAPELLHGKVSAVEHSGAGVLNGLPSPFQAARYHSLAVRADTVPDELEVTATTGSGVVMALRARDADIEGVQFHPESVMTEFGHRMVANWLQRCGAADAVARAEGIPTVRAPAPAAPPD